MDERPDAGLSKELFNKVPSGATHADAATQTKEDLSETQESLSETREDSSGVQEDQSQNQAHVGKKRWLEEILGFEPSEEPDQDELNAEITQAEYYRDRRPLGGLVDGVALSRPFAPRERTIHTSNYKNAKTIAESTEGEASSSARIDNNVESIYHLCRSVDVSNIPRTPEMWKHIELEPNYHLEIKSPLIIELLRNIVLFRPQELSGKVIIIPEPYMLLWHHHRALRRFNEDPQSDKDTKKHLEVLINFLDSNSTDAAEFKSVDAFDDLSRRITYRNAWYLYRPGSLADAALVPIEQLENYEELCASLKEKGLRYWQFQGQHLKGLRGKTGESQEELDRIIVDEATYRRRRKLKGVGPRRDVSSESEDSSDSDTGERDKVPQLRELIKPDQLDSSQKEGDSYYLKGVQAKAKPEDYVLMSVYQYVNGFSLRQKKWKIYHVNDLGDVHFREDAFNRLVLDESYKDILRRVIEHHSYEREDQLKDLVDGKGQGLLILLHGPPGVGKTLAAESIAELYRRPLYSVTSGDIGTKPDEAEMSIRRIFEYAVIWKAIVLMDEADIFLAQRDTENIERNALVSVFLRNLEYFDGIMILTTNRVGVIDEAFQSRLDVALALEPFTINERTDVWFNFIEDLPPQISEKERDLLRREVKKVWSHKDLNGRQIKNCVKTASVLAKQHDENVNVKHIRTTIKTVLKFTNYIQDVYKMDPERRAEKHGIRNHRSAKASQPAASSGRSGRQAVGRTQRGRRSSSLELDDDDDDDLGSDI
ncbi:MAG: hypothetical protein OHK93_006809 [Ramalina farinacea]|uniref:AAA+ ATPase domain-containing protein n=1 Tax=Ramalina farinacea TaxID=258253 RepID=A0AA43QKZ0_9LECA|nr:hypothetical protein [Ramalina farinacea]